MERFFARADAADELDAIPAGRRLGARQRERGDELVLVNCGAFHRH